MLNTYFKIAFRNLWKHRVFSAINILGLAVASAFCLLIYWYVQNEKSYDNFYPNGKNVYRIEMTNLFDFGDLKPKKSFFSFLVKDDYNQKNMAGMPAPLADDIKAAIPEINQVLRMAEYDKAVVRYNNQSYQLKKGHALTAEKNFFQVFQQTIVQGNASSILSVPNNVAISEEAAKKYFGNENAAGKILSVNNEDGEKLYTVSGVFKNFPANSSMQYDLITAFNPEELKENIERGYNSMMYYTFAELKEHTFFNAVAKKTDAFGKAKFGEMLKKDAEASPDKKPLDFHLKLRPVSECHYSLTDGWGHYTNLSNIYLLCCIALVVLLIATVNYILLALTNTISRSKEVGVRKTIGAKRKQIITQFWVETILISFIAVVTGILLAVLFIPLFNNLTGATIELKDIGVNNLLLLFAALITLLSLLAGAYPALAMSALKPLSMMGKNATYKLNPVVARLMATVQFSICMALIICALIIQQQMKYINNKSIGFDKEQTLIIENPYSYGQPEYSQLKNKMQQYTVTEPGIKTMTTTSFKFAGRVGSDGYIINGNREMVYRMNVDYNYFNLMSIPLVKGRFFSPEFTSDTTRLVVDRDKLIKETSVAQRNLIVNETLYKMLDNPPIDNSINRSMGGIIVGVCKDYHFFGLTKKVAPMYHSCNIMFPRYIYLKLAAVQNLPALINKIKTQWDVLTGNQPFEFSFLDQDIQKEYDQYSKWMQTINIAALMAIIIACLGLFGLSAINAVNRTKEIGIRKVMGASVQKIFTTLNKQVIILAIISFVIAMPVAYYVMQNWLNDFAYRITIGWQIFAIGGIAGIVTALIAVSYHSLKASLANPVKSLRSE
jgi:putative ABC transport system permease protein